MSGWLIFKGNGEAVSLATFIFRQWLMKESSGGKNAAVSYQMISRLFMGACFSNHSFTCSKLYSPVMTAVWSFMATNRTLS